MAKSYMNGGIHAEGTPIKPTPKRRPAARAALPAPIQAPAPAKKHSILDWFPSPWREIVIVLVMVLGWLQSNGWLDGIARRSEITALKGQIESVDRRIDSVDKRLDGIETTLTALRDNIVANNVRDEMRNRPSSSGNIRVVTKPLPAITKPDKTEKPKSLLGDLLGQ